MKGIGLMALVLCSMLASIRSIFSGLFPFSSISCRVLSSLSPISGKCFPIISAASSLLMVLPILRNFKKGAMIKNPRQAIDTVK